MTDEFSQGVLLKVVAQICQMIGFHKIMTSPLHILADILKEFICHLGQTAQHYAEHCGRSCLDLSDLSLAFFDSGIDPSDLAEFLKTISPLPQSLHIPKYPVSKTKEVSPPGVSENKYNNEVHRERLKITISLSKIKSASKSKRKKSTKNKKNKKKKRSRP